MNSTVFVDSSFWKAYVDRRDDFHNKALPILDRLMRENCLLLTTNYILDETFTLIRVKCGLQLAIDLKSMLEEVELGLEITRVLAQDDVVAWDWFRNDWSKLSFTDCVSFAVMKRLVLTRVATFDPHFARAGFKIER